MTSTHLDLCSVQHGTAYIPTLHCSVWILTVMDSNHLDFSNNCNKVNNCFSLLQLRLVHLLIAQQILCFRIILRSRLH